MDPAPPSAPTAPTSMPGTSVDGTAEAFATLDREAIADALYALPADAFTATRNAAAKSLRGVRRRDDAAAIAALVRPSAGASVLNRVARHRPELVEALLVCGDELRAAQDALLARTGGAADLHAASQRRRDAAHRIAAAMVEEIASGAAPADARQRDDWIRSLEAASTDQALGEVLRRGRCTRLTKDGVGLDGISRGDPPTHADDTHADDTHADDTHADDTHADDTHAAASHRPLPTATAARPHHLRLVEPARVEAAGGGSPEVHVAVDAATDAAAAHAAQEARVRAEAAEALLVETMAALAMARARHDDADALAARTAAAAGDARRSAEAAAAGVVAADEHAARATERLTVAVREHDAASAAREIASDAASVAHAAWAHATAVAATADDDRADASAALRTAEAAVAAARATVHETVAMVPSAAVTRAPREPT